MFYIEQIICKGKSEFQITYYFFSHSQTGTRNFRHGKFHRGNFRRLEFSTPEIFTSEKISGGDNPAHQSNPPKKGKNFLKRRTLHPSLVKRRYRPHLNFNCFKKFINRNLDFVVDVRLLALSSTLISGI